MIRMSAGIDPKLANTFFIQRINAQSVIKSIHRWNDVRNHAWTRALDFLLQERPPTSTQLAILNKRQVSLIIIAKSSVRFPRDIRRNVCEFRQILANTNDAVGGRHFGARRNHITNRDVTVWRNGLPKRDIIFIARPNVFESHGKGSRCLLIGIMFEDNCHECAARRDEARQEDGPKRYEFILVFSSTRTKLIPRLEFIRRWDVRFPSA